MGGGGESSGRRAAVIRSSCARASIIIECAIDAHGVFQLIIQGKRVMDGLRVGFGGWLTAAALVLGAAAAQAAAAPVKEQAPGYYRTMLGDWEVTSLSDGTFPMPVDKLLVNVTPPALDAALERSFLKNPVEASVNGFLVNTGGKLVLIDTGAGVFFGPSVGKLAANLRAAGYRPEQVDDIYITHMHGDHVGGLIADGRRVFPNAVVHASKPEADYWLSKAAMDAAPAEAKGGFQQAMSALQPYVAAGKFKTFEGETELLPGLRAIPNHGHTPGHTIYVASHQGQSVVFWGDLMHVAAVQFADPAVAIRYDFDPVMAVAQRKKVFADVAAQRSWVAGAHLSFPGIGHLRQAGGGYEFVPANYSSLH